jgi:hypothetical protein
MNLSLTVQVLTDYCATLSRYFGTKIGFCNSGVVSYARLAHHAAPEVASFLPSTSFRIRSTSGSSRTALTSSFLSGWSMYNQPRATISGDALGPTYLSHTPPASRRPGMSTARVNVTSPGAERQDVWNG